VASHGGIAGLPHAAPDTLAPSVASRDPGKSSDLAALPQLQTATRDLIKVQASDLMNQI
jgi:hypothetical protein